MTANLVERITQHTDRTLLEHFVLLPYGLTVTVISTIPSR